MKTIYGFDLITDPLVDKGLESSLYYTGTYEPGTLKLLSTFLSPGDCFIDIGGNIGLMSIYASQCVKDNGKVYTFEANPDTIEILNENINLNQIKNITVFPFALGSELSKGKIYTNLEKNRGSASIVSRQKDSDFHEIEIKPLDSVISTDQEVCLIKMDIEGFELEALKGMKQLLGRSNPPKLIIECGEAISGVESNKKTVFEFIDSFKKYKIYKLKSGKAKNSDLILVDNPEQLDIHENMICIPNQ